MAGKCTLCQKSLGKDNKREVTTSCGHTFHRECANQRLIKSKSNDCPACRKPSALHEALVSNDDRRVSVPIKPEKNNGTTGHDFPALVLKKALQPLSLSETNDKEWPCSQCSVKNPASARRCESCGAPKHSASSVLSATRKTSAAASVTDELHDRTPLTTESPRSHHRSTAMVKSRHEDHTEMRARMNDERQDRQDETDWKCEICHRYNRISDALCRLCRSEKPLKSEPEYSEQQSKRDLPPVRRSSLQSSLSSSVVSKIYPELDNDRSSSPQSTSDRRPLPKIGSTPTPSTKVVASSEGTHDTNAKSKSSKEKTQPSKSSSVYICDLPLDMGDDQQLVSLIHSRVKKTLNIEPNDIRCYSKLGVGIMSVSDNQTKDYLVNDVGKLTLQPKEGKNLISFVDTLELVSYIVIEVKKEKKDLLLPTTEEISYRWRELFKGDKPVLCEQLNAQFPNIYRIFSKSLSQLVNSIHLQDFNIKNQFGRIYFCADCSFLEDIPRSTTQDQLQAAIVKTINHPHISSSSLYIQINKQTGNACIIATDIARKWSATSYLYLDGKPISKKNDLTCYLLIHPIPQTLSIQTILTHQVFANKISNHQRNGENLILEITDKSVFDDCITRGALRIGDKTLLYMEAYIASNNPEGSEINADTWYETEMPKYKPDIMQFVANPQHAIFRYKWNPKIWLELFESATAHKPSSSYIKPMHTQKDATPDQLRHQLQVTVMLNTLAAILKKSYIVGDREIKLNLNNNLKTIVYNHQSKLEKGGKIPIKAPPYTKTIVQVVESDCVVVYEQLLKKGKRPLLLNMASATSPGGGYRKGDGAQEENLFRRSDYFRSLDIGLDDFIPQTSKRLQCSSNGQLETLSDPSSMYPMEEFSAIYTSGLTFFRHSQDVGYKYMDNPVENVCSIAMAAYRDPKLEGKLLASKHAVGTRKKIENIFAIAYYNKHDSLVLSALGCGAFRNPPGHVAKLFSSVIDQYAGFFDTIVFAIIDDHNAGHKLNPEGNVKPFSDILHNTTVNPILTMNKPNTVFGPYRLASDGLTVNDVCICDLPPCMYGAKCRDITNTDHIRQFSHPPLCINVAINGKCNLSDNIVHMTSFIHRHQCQYGGDCRNIDDKKHNQEYEHPSYCRDGGSCQNMEEDHLKEYRHLTLCKDGQKCMEYQKHNKKHCDAYRHCKRLCPYGNSCVRFHDKNHISELQHPFSPPCPHAPFQCQFYATLSEATDTRTLEDDVQRHCLDYAHVCRFGRDCKDNTPLHLEKSIHIARHLCPYSDKCKKLNQDEHLNSFTHPKIADIRRVCKHAEKCRDRGKLEHITKFRHAMTSEESGVVRYYGLNNGINFVQNQSDSIARVLNYIKTQNIKPLPSGSIPHEILNWFRTVQPVHRCNPLIFESIFLHGHVMSRSYMENLKIPKFVSNSVMQHSRVRRIENLHIPQYEQHAKEYITAIVSIEFNKANFPPPPAIAAPPVGGGVPPTLPPPPDSTPHFQVMRAKEKILSTTIPHQDLTALKTKAIEIAQASIKLHSNPSGIGHGPDKALGTDKHVFSILGPHQGHYYGDIFIVFKREILHHPDADFSIQAATSFHSGNAYKWRPWLGTDPGTPDERIKFYHKSQLHASIPGYEYAAALELMALTSYQFKTGSMDIDLQTILKRWLHVDSHTNIEAHLPQLIPLDYIDHIYIPQNIFDSLNADTHKAIKAVFKNAHTVTPHQGDANQDPGPFGPMPTSKERADYQTYVVGELLKKYSQYSDHPPARPIRGAIITVAATDFNDSFLVPLTISQAYEQHSKDHSKPPTENIAYIYWQALNGDMMLILSNEMISAEHQPNLRCLICYIPPRSTAYDGVYFEQHTYLNCGYPDQHHVFVKKNQYKAKSNTFHIGCNMDEFLTYCLEIHRTSGKVILRQAGSNAIYNHEEICCEFTQKELDLTKLEFIQVSAGIHEVPVRNLIVCFEKQADLHPTFDKDFKKSTSTAPRASSAAPAKRTDEGSGYDSSSLQPCRDNVNCLRQYERGASSHNAQYSHPCRFSELCRNKEPHLTHDPHPSPLCKNDTSCEKITDPHHRADYRHTDLPDFLVPCRNQTKCDNKSKEHRIKYSHGEQVFEQGATGTSEKPYSTSQDEKADRRYVCKWGSQCRTIGDPNHRAKYSHPKSE